MCTKKICVHGFFGNCRKVLPESTDNHLKKKNNGMKISTDENKTKTNRWQIDNKIHERESILKREEIFKNYNTQI